MKDIDSAARSRFIRVAVWVFPIIGFLGFFVGFSMYGKPGAGLAIGVVVGILKKAPDLPEALYMKAQILVEGYRKQNEAKILLERILTVLPERGETYHRWAQTLLDDINMGL